MTTTLDPTDPIDRTGDPRHLRRAVGRPHGAAGPALSPTHAATGTDLAIVLTDRPEIVGARPGTTP